MNDPHANRGYKGLSGTSAISTKSCQGFTPDTDDFVIAAITHPTSERGRIAYDGDTAFIIGRTLVKGLYYPIPFTSITLTSGAGFGWIE